MQSRTTLLAPFTLFVLSISVALGVWRFLADVETLSKPATFSDFMRDLDAGKIEQVTIAGQRVTVIYRDNKASFHSYAPAHYRGLAVKLDEAGVLVNR